MRFTICLRHCLFCTAWLATVLGSETADVIYTDRRTDPAIVKAAAELRDAGRLVDGNWILSSLDGKPKCKLNLPAERTQALKGREIWELARRSYLRVGWYYQCKRCDKWHLNLAGGYVITADGAAATCQHVLKPPGNFKNGHLIAATDDGKVIPVTDVLAASAKLDAAIIKLAAGWLLVPLPISDGALPGDTVYCFSDPMGFRGYFSQGMVNRYCRYERKAGPKAADGQAAAEKTEPPPVTLNVSTDWAPGSSGAAVLDDRGNAIGHVSRILPVEQSPRKKTEANDKPGTLMVVHDAVPASAVLSLIERNQEDKKQPAD